MEFGCDEYKNELCPFSDHYMLAKETGIIKSQRDLASFLKYYETYGREKCYLYTGRGPSTGEMHLGHMLPFMVTKALQQALGIRVVILLTDDEKFLFRREHALETYTSFAHRCKHQILQLGFLPELTTIYIGSEDISVFYSTLLKIQDKITYSQAVAAFGFVPSDSIGKIGFLAYEMAPCDSRPMFKTNMRCLVICAWDQDPFFRLVRDHAGSLGFCKPALLHLEYLPGLDGSLKMNSTGDDIDHHRHTVLWLTDNEPTIREKIRKHAFSGGRMTRKEQEEQGANVKVDIACIYLNFFMANRELYKTTVAAYSKGTLLTSAVKSICVDVLVDLLRVFK